MLRLTIEEAVAHLRRGEIVALPTETVYGLAGRVDSEDTIARIFQAKGRPTRNPLICHISSVEMLERYALVDEDDRSLFSFWPGPLTILLRKRSGIPDAVTAGSALCAFRIPSHPLFREAIEKTGVPLAAPSANLSGQTSPVTVDMVEHALDGRIPGVVDGGPCSVGLESTVIMRRGRKVFILRPGAIGQREFERSGFLVDDSLTEPAITEHSGSGLLSPGRLATHYAPPKPLILIDTIFNEKHFSQITDCIKSEDVVSCIQTMFESPFEADQEEIQLKNMDFKHPAWLLYSETPMQERSTNISVHSPAPPGKLSVFASELYSSLTSISEEASVILAFSVPERDIGIAINDRLRRAAGVRLTPKMTNP